MSELMKHQVEGIAWLKEHPRAALLDEPGLGKTAQALLAATAPLLIVAPAMIVAAGVWESEITKWCPIWTEYPTIVSYHGLVRKDGRKYTPLIKPEFKRKWGTVIFDESHHLKNRNAYWTRAAMKLETDCLYMLTGTPIPNWAHEAFTQLRLLWPGHPAFKSYWRWIEEWFEVGPLLDRAGRVLSQYNITGLRKDVGGWERFRSENWADRSLLRKRDDCLDLPELTEQTYKVKLIPEQRRVYNALRKDFVAWLDSGAEIAAWNSADQFMKLAQLATQFNGYGAKIEALKTLLKDRQMPTLVVAHFRASVRAANEAAYILGFNTGEITGTTHKEKRNELVRRFQGGEIDVLCATLDTISEGLTLHRADQIIFLERSWRPTQNEQAMRRIHRIGQERPVSAIHLVAEDTLDERVIELLKDKTAQQMAALPLSTIKELI